MNLKPSGVSDAELRAGVSDAELRGGGAGVVWLILVF